MYVEEEARKQVKDLKKIAEKTGLQTSFDETEIITTLFKFLKTCLDNTYGEIRYTNNFKYLGENIFQNASDKESFKIRKLKLIKAITWELYGKKNLSRSVKVRHYSTVIRPVIMYGMETMCF